MFNATHHPLPLRKTMFFYDHNFSMNGKTVHNTANNFFFQMPMPTHMRNCSDLTCTWHYGTCPAYPICHTHTHTHLIFQPSVGELAELLHRLLLCQHDHKALDTILPPGEEGGQNSQCRGRCTMYYLSVINVFKLKYIRMLHNNTVHHFPEEKRAAMYYITLV